MEAADPEAESLTAQAPMKPFVLIFSSALGDRNVLCDWFNSRSEVLNWAAPPIPNVLIITSRHTAHELGALIRHRFARKQFLISEISFEGSDGWLATPIWEHIRNPRSSGHWA